MGCEGGDRKPEIFVPGSKVELEEALYDATMTSDSEDIRAGNRLDYEGGVVGFALLKQELHSSEHGKVIRDMLRAVLRLPAFNTLHGSECEK